MSQPIDTLAIEIEANASNSVDGIRKLSRALTSLSKSISSVNGAGINKVANSIGAMNTATANMGTATAKATMSTKRYVNMLPSLVSHTNKASHSTKSLAYHFGKFYANMFLVIRGVKALGKSISSTMDYMESFNFWDVAITSATGKTSEWKELGYDSAQAYGEAFKQGLADFNEKMTGFKTDVNSGDISISGMSNLGINITELTTFQAEIVSITSSLGLCTRVSQDTAKALSMLAGDMSSLKNIDLATVMTNFQSGLIGQSRALYKYGIDITNATLQTYAYECGITKAVSEMTQAEKMQLRMLAILDQSKVAWGDLANTLNQPANQFRVLKNGVKNLAITIGKLLMPVVSTVLPYLNAMVKALQTFFTWLANILGIELNVENTGTGTTDIFEGIEDSADDATDAVNSLKKSMTQLGIDELNINNPNNDSGGGSGSAVGGGGVDLSDEINAALAEYERAWEEAYANMTDKATAMADAIVDAFKRKDYKGIGTYISDGITNALNSISWNDVYSVAGDFGSGFAQFLNGLFTPDVFGAVGRTIAGSLNTAIRLALSFGEEFDFYTFGEAIAEGINEFFINFDSKKLARAINTWVDGIKDTIRGFLEKLSWSDILGSTLDFFKTLELDTFTFIAKVITLKYLGKLLTSKMFQDVISQQLFGGTGKIGGSGVGLTAGLTVLVTFEFLDGTAKLIENIKEYGWKEGSRRAVEEDNAYGGFRGSGLGMLLENLFKSKEREHDGAGINFPDENGITHITNVPDTSDKSFFDWTDKVVEAFNDMYDAGGEWAKGNRESIASWADNTSKSFNEWKKNASDTFSSWCDDVSTSISDWSEDVQDNFEDWKDNVSTTVEDWKLNVQNKFTQWKTNVTTTVDGWKTNIQNKFTEWKTNVSTTVEGWRTTIQTKFTQWKTNVTTTVDGWKTNIQNKFTEWKTNVTTTVSTWRTNVESAFSTWKSNTVSQVSAWSGNIISTFSNWASNTRNTVSSWYTNITGYFSSHNWNFSGIREGLSNAFNSAFDAVKEIWNNIKRFFSQNPISAGVSIATGGVGASINRTIKGYATGGYPDSFSMFMAGENGVPELLGTVGGRTAVAGGAEITGIADAVYSTGQTEASLLVTAVNLLQEIADKDFSTHIGDKEIAQAVVRGQRQLGATIRTT